MYRASWAIAWPSSFVVLLHAVDVVEGLTVLGLDTDQAASTSSVHHDTAGTCLVGALERISIGERLDDRPDIIELVLQDVGEQAEALGPRDVPAVLDDEHGNMRLAVILGIGILGNGHDLVLGTGAEVEDPRIGSLHMAVPRDGVAVLLGIPLDDGRSIHVHRGDSRAEVAPIIPGDEEQPLGSGKDVPQELRPADVNGLLADNGGGFRLLLILCFQPTEYTDLGKVHAFQ